MRCDQIRKLIPIYLDGGLEDGRDRELKDHVSGCLVCRKELEAYQRSWQMLGEWKDIQPEAGYVGRFWTAVSQQRPWHEQILKALPAGVFQKRLAPVFVAICILLVTGIFSLRNYWQMVETGELLANLSAEELEIAFDHPAAGVVEDIELAENLDIIQDMDFLEDMEVIENADSLELI